MRVKHRVYYTVTNFEGFWYQRGKWIKREHFDKRYGASSNYHCLTFKQAKRSMLNCPAIETIIVKTYIKHGERWEREYIYRR